MTGKNRSCRCEYKKSSGRKYWIKEVVPLEIHVRPESKAVEIWLNYDEKDNKVVREGLQPLYKRYHKLGYLTAVFLSGEADLTKLTSDLLIQNRRKAAEQEARTERQQAMQMSM